MFLLLIAGVILLWKLQDLLFRRMWDKNLSVRLEFEDGHIYEGDQSALKEVLVNDKRFPIPAVDVRLAINRNLKFISRAKENSTISDQTYKRDVFSFAGRQQITRRLRFVGVRRGFYEFKEVDVSGYNFFMQFAGKMILPQSAGIFVYPRMVSTEKINLLCQEISGMVISQRKINPDPFEFYGIREYVNTDPMNQINWKASVRTGNLMVNQFDSTTNIRLWLLLDLEDSRILKEEELLEEGIRIAASLAGKLAAGNMPLTLWSDAMDEKTKEALELYMPAGGGRIVELYEKLSCIDLEKIRMSTMEFLQAAEQRIREDMTCIWISKEYNQEVIDQLGRLAQGVNILWILPRYSYEEPVSLTIPGVKILSWEVTR